MRTLIADLNFMKHDVRITGIRNSELKFIHAKGIYGLIYSSHSRKGITGFQSNCHAATHFVCSRLQGLSGVFLSPLKHAFDVHTLQSEVFQIRLQEDPQVH